MQPLPALHIKALTFTVKHLIAQNFSNQQIPAIIPAVFAEICIIDYQ